MMKKFNTLSFLFIALLFIACEKKENNGLSTVKWDRDMCERCVMIISEKAYAVQIEHPTTKKKYKFDDIGCAVLWFKESKQNWFNQANIWVKDEKSKSWINARKALWTYGNITPMNYGLAAYVKETIPKDKKVLDFTKAINIINEQDKEDRLRRQHRLHNKG